MSAFRVPANVGILADMGVLYNLSKPNMLDVLTRSGLSHLTQKELAKIMEAAILISPLSSPFFLSHPFLYPTELASELQHHK